MANKLLIRLYDVGLGDCIYCRIPNAHESGRDFHILIDCGTLSSTDYLEAALDNLKTMLPEIDGKRHVDLLVVTHEHKDHMTGFGLDLWGGLSFGAIWMSAAMDLDHPEAKRAKKLHSFAANAMEQAVRLNLSLSPPLMELAAALALNKNAMKTLRETLPKASKIKPVYVHANAKKTELALPLRGAEVSVLGPEKDIDFYYLGKEGDQTLRRFGFGDTSQPDPSAAVPRPDTVPTPANIDPADFRQLRSRMLSTALAFADLDGKVCNNTSVVLLIEWKGKRLLFVGDAEWDGAYKEGKANCAWNVMWKLRKEKLKGPLAFYKIGHHGSVNATPWGMTPAASAGEPLAILDAILPVQSKAGARAIVSTRRGNYETIPRTDLLAEIGKRVANTRNYADAFKKAGKKTSEVPKFGEFEKESFAQPQPMRTDLERMLQDQKGFIDVEIEG
ncbi:metallohydrolase [Bradyrhizobium sp. BWA-3-5]|uniref:metallohydrolase n=1 Tax=Bradyrhizobium sp. BWA-3-5 TaxID=3080013 RepID=UPI00293E0D7F|nr:metallohydrolase [Bradyrhizobium sp. BWA-3-5]WOH65310.1 metallohydrolase [Bradyrhizobium sp. BWA-3-5]